jgi:hypothetical protein
MGALADYKANVEARGGYFFAALPSNVPGISRTDIGKVGARFPNFSPTAAYTFEVAPELVQLEAAGSSFLDSILSSVTGYAVDNPLGVGTWGDDWQAGLDSFQKQYQAVKDALPGASVLDILAAVLGISKTVLVVVLLVLGYAMLRGTGLVPPLKQVFA